MHDIWNPWHGCIKKSAGCQNCYMYFLDKQRGQNGAHIRQVKNAFDYPLQKNADGKYKIKSGEQIRVCMTSDFFLEEADSWRPKAWEMIWTRSDVVFFLLTKRPERVRQCLPENWGDGWENVFFHVSCENQAMADERLPFLAELPFKHKGVMTAPFIGPISLEPYLSDIPIEEVIAGGENYDGSRPLRYEWVKNLYDECVRADVKFTFIETGTFFEKDGKTYHLSDKEKQSLMAYKSGLRHSGRPIDFKLEMPQKDLFGENDVYVPYFSKRCETCGSRPICNGCTRCGKCSV